MRIKMIDDKTLNTHCRFIWDCTEEEFLNWVNKKYKTAHKPNGAYGKSVMYQDENKIGVNIWLENKNNLTTLAHEVLHIVRFWLQDFQGINLTEETEEIYTLLHSFYFQEILKILGHSKLGVG